MSELKYKRVLLKLSGEALAGEKAPASTLKPCGSSARR